MSITSSISLFQRDNFFGSSNTEGSISSNSLTDDLSAAEDSLAESPGSTSKTQFNNMTTPFVSSVIKNPRSSAQLPYLSNYNNTHSNGAPFLNQNPQQIEEFLMLTNSLLFKHFPFAQMKDASVESQLHDAQSERKNAKFFTSMPSPPPCRICRIETAKVSHFGVTVCTGCRAFFRRSVSQQKTYTCLKGKLCGDNDKLVPSRRVCKFCRFQRCVAAGMLKGKEQLQLQHLEETLLLNKRNGISTAKTHNPSIVSLDQSLQRKMAQTNPEILPPHEYFTSTDLNKNILDAFMVTRRKITYERMQLYYNNPIQFAEHRKDFAVYLQECTLFKRNFIETTAPFNGFSERDQTLIFTEYSMHWTIIETLWATIRKDGHHSNRNYFFDGRYIQLNEDDAMRHWGSVFESTFGEKDPMGLVKRSLVNYYLATAIFWKDCACQLAKACLSDEEAAAFFLLVCTRQEVLVQVSKSGMDELRKLREKILRNLCAYLDSSGQNVPKRLDQIISLIAPIQEAVCLWKRCHRLCKAAFSFADSEYDQLCPDYSKYVEMVEKVDQYIENIQISDDISSAE